MTWSRPSWGSGEPFALAGELKAALARGGCAVVICNTVGRAQRVWDALRRALPARWGELRLLHARFLFKDRAEREGAVLRAFGKPGEAERPGRAILVATQIVEQSLDLDFDLMVSDHAPVDLLLQRIGRLHRHRREGRPAGLAEPTVWVGRPQVDTAGVSAFERGSVLVYGEHVLLRSWLALTYPRAREHLALPTDIEGLVEAAYDDWACPEGVAPSVAERWALSLAKREAELERERRAAEDRWLQSPAARASLLVNLMPRPREEDAPEFHPAHQALTRLTEPTVRIVCLWARADGSLALERAGGDTVRLRARPAPDEAAALLERSVAITDRRVVYRLLEQAPTPWRESALLRDYRLVRLDEPAGAAIGPYRLRVDDDLGIVIDDGAEPAAEEAGN